MKKTILALLVAVTLIMGVFAFSVFGEETTEETVTFAPYTAEDGTRQYCVCGNAFVAEDGTTKYVNGEDGCKNHKDESGNIVAGCDGTLLTWQPWNETGYLPKNSGDSGNWYLTETVQMTTQNSIQENVQVVLDLNGFEARGAENTRVYSIHKAGASLVLTDTSAAQTGKLISHGTNKDHSLTMWVYLGSMEMYGGTIDASGMTSSSNSGPCMRVNANMTFDMFGGKIIGGTANKYGGSIYITSGGTVNLYGGEIYGGTAANGGNIYSDNGTVNLYGCKIHDGTATNGGNIYSTGGTLSIYGDEIYGGTVTNNGGNIWASGTVTISGGEIYNGKSTGNPVYDSANSKYKVNNAAVGGNVYIGGGGDLTMTGGHIYDGIINGNRGGNIFFYGNSGTDTSNVSITGGYIWGGQINADDSDTGTEALNASGDLQGGSIYYYLAGEYTVGGNAVIGMKPDGTAAGGQSYRGGNLGLSSATVLNVTGGTIYGGNANDGGNIYSFGKLYLTGGKITGGTAVNNGGNICINYGELQMSGTAEISGGNAKTGGAIGTVAGSGGDRVINISGGTIAENTTTGNGGALYVLGYSEKETNITISGGTFRNNTAGGNGGAMSVNTRYCTVDITDGSFEENSASKGGHIYINYLGTHSISGGTFTGGNAANGGSIYLDTDVENNVSIIGGTFSGGIATESGGNFYIAGTVTISDGTISDGTAAGYGGNVYANGSLTLSGGTISDGDAKDGGSVALRGGTHTFTGGTITGGASESAGGNLFVGSSAKATIDNVTITNGTAGGMGGGLYMGSGTVTINNCLFQGNRGSRGGNVAVYAGTLNFNGGQIKDGVSETWGGNLWTDHGTLNISGGEITGGSATYGGGIALANTKNGNRVLNITGGLISGNSSDGGGGLYIHGYKGYTTTVTISGGEISGNTANGNGGGITMGTSYCSLTITGDAVIKDNTATKLGGNINMNYDGEKVVSGGTITGGTAASGSCINVEGKSVTISGTPTIDAIRVNNATDGRLEVSDAAWTTAIPVEVTGQGAFATASSDKTACFTPADALYQITYDATAQELLINLPVLEHVYVGDNGNDYGAGTEADPYKTLDRALNVVSQNGTVHIVDVLTVTSWEEHGKTLTITGGELVMPETRANLWDNVTFESLTITMPMCTTNTSSNYGSYFFYCNGFKTVFAQSATIRYLYNGTYMDDPYHTVTQTLSDGTTKELTGTSTLYGGGPSSTGVLTGTDLTVMTGHWGNIYGGSNGVDIDGDVHLTVGGAVNDGVDYISHTHSSWHVILGGSRAADITGTIYMNVTGGNNHTSTHGGSNGTCSIGAIELHVTGGNGMAIYGAGKGGVNTVGTVNFYYEGGTFEQVFGGVLSNCLVGDVNFYVTGGNITRRLYGGCYSNCDESSGNWTADNFVTGDINLYIGSGAEITCDLKDPDAGWESIITGGYYADRGIYGHSRRAAPDASDVENSRIIFLDYAAYTANKDNLTAQDSIMANIMKGVTAADYICYLGINASGNVITVGATEVEDNASNALDLASGTATITVPEGTYIYEGTALTPAQVTYSDNWTYGELPVTYTGNDKAGTATASITYEGATASTNFTVELPCDHSNTTTSYAQVKDTETHTVTVTCECGEQISQTTEACVDADKNFVCDHCQAALKQPVAQVGDTQYTSLQEAIDNAGDGYVQLLADCADATVSSNLYLDLNGYHLTNVTVSDGYTLNLFDSTTDDYQGAYGTAAVTGNVSSFVEYGGKTYLVVADENGLYSAHCYAVKLTHVSLKPSDDALGYKAQLLGDEIVLAHVKSFGFNLSVAGGASKTCIKEAGTDFDGIFTLRLKGIMAANGGEMEITGSAFIIFDIEDKTVTTGENTTSMKETILAVNELTTLSDEQKAAVGKLYAQYQSVMAAWFTEDVTNNIATWIPTEE